MNKRAKVSSKTGNWLTGWNVALVSRSCLGGSSWSSVRLGRRSWCPVGRQLLVVMDGGVAQACDGSGGGMDARVGLSW